MLSAVVGILVTFLSIWGMIAWREDLGVVARGFFPLCFLAGGIIATVAGISSFARKKPSEKIQEPSAEKTESLSK